MARRGAKKSWFDSINETRRSAFAEGWGVPISGFVVTCCIGAGVAFGSMQSGDIWTPPPQAWAGLATVLFAFSQFGANSCLARWSKGPRKLWSTMFVAFVIFNGMTALGIHHAWEQYRAPAWEREVLAQNGDGNSDNGAEGAVAERMRARAPWEEQLRQANEDARNANAALLQIATDNEAVTSRLDSRGDSARAALTAAQEAKTEAQQQLAALPRLEPLPHERPWDALDWLFVGIAIALGVLEFAIWSSIHPKRDEIIAAQRPKQAEIVVEAAEIPEAANVTALPLPEQRQRGRRRASSGRPDWAGGWGDGG